jgi:dolichol-phosphate mannosyltransferase
MSVVQKAKLNLEQLIYVNDGSTDETIDILTSLAQKNSCIEVVDLSRNFGHQAAVSAGLSLSKADLTVILDADLQDPPEVIPEMIQLCQKEKSNVVYAVRKNRHGESWFKKTSAHFFYWLINKMINRPFPENTGDFRLIDRKVLKVFNQLPEKGKYIRGLISWVGFKQTPFYYDRHARFAGETKYPLKKMLPFAANAIFSFSHKPLQLSTTFGIFSLLVSFLLGLYALLSLWLYPSHTVPGWASTLVVIAFFGGIQLIALAIIGEYMSILFQEIKGRPEYIISEHFVSKSKQTTRHKVRRV